jgi:hypothetical protein
VVEDAKDILKPFPFVHCVFKETYIIAGTTQNQNTGATEPVAMRVNDRVAILRRNGEHVVPASVQDVQSGAEIITDGKRSKRGAIRARHVVI